MTNLPNNNQLPPIDNHNSPNGEPVSPREEGEPTLGLLTQEAQSVFEKAGSPFELSQQFQRIKIRSHAAKNNSLNG